MSTNMKGRVCLVTGANSGIGRSAALGLAETGATVVMVCRDRDKGEAARSDIVARSRNDAIDLMLADLSSQSSIRQLAAQFREKHDELHVLLNNAGKLSSQRTTTVDGLETTFAVNHLGYFLLTLLLIEVLKASAPSRIVNVSSSAHRMGTIKFDDLQLERGYGGYKAYSQSKLANVLFTYELARKLEGTGVTVNSLHPGTVRTNLFKGVTGPVGAYINLLKPLMKSSGRGAETAVYLACSPEVEGITGKYFINKKVAKSWRRSHDTEMGQRLWQVSCQLTNLPADI